MPVLHNAEFREANRRCLQWNWHSNFDISLSLESLRLRRRYIQEFGYALLTEEAIEALLPFGPWLEIGAGAAYWAHELQRAGCGVVATDLIPPDIDTREKKPHFDLGRKTWTKVLPMSAVEAVQAWSDRNLLSIWPSYDEPWAYKALLQSKAQYVAYVGEGHGGCTADDAFHCCLDTDFEQVKRVLLPTFFGIHDDLCIYKRLSQPLHLLTDTETVDLEDGNIALVEFAEGRRFREAE